MATTTSYTSQAYAVETEPGTINDPVTFQAIPTTGGSIESNITTAMSEEIRSDRMTTDLIPVDSSISGDLNYELGYDTYKPLMIALLENNTTRAVSETLCDYNIANVDRISKTGIEGNVEIGDVLHIESVSDPVINGDYVCTDNTVADQITIYPDVSATMTTQADITVDATTIVENGADTPVSYTFRQTAVESGTTYYWYNRGCKINTMSFNFATGSILTGSMGILGLTQLATGTVTPNETVTPIVTSPIMNAVNSIGTIYLEGLTVGTCSFTKLDLSVDNKLLEAKSIGTLGACATEATSLEITGSVDIYFKDLTAYNMFLNSNSFATTIILNDEIDGSGSTIGINMPKCKFENLSTNVSGKDQFLVQSGSFKALRDDTDGYMVKFSFVD